jgi:hypothetical protein
MDDNWTTIPRNYNNAQEEQHSQDNAQRRWDEE